MKLKRSVATIVLLSSLFMALASAVVSAQAGGSEMAESAPVEGVSFRDIRSNGIAMRIAEAGTGPLVLMAHGWPESWYSWRHQMLALAAAGYHVVAPQMRGYGKTDSPQDVDSFDIVHLAGDMVGVLDALGEETAVMVGHDWGSIVAWNSVLLHPERFTALVAMSVPYGGRGSTSPLESMKAANGDNFFYIIYHQEPGVAEAEYDADPRGIISRLYLSPGAEREAPTITDPLASAGGWIGRLGAPKAFPQWLEPEDMDYIVGQFEESGFRGGVNYYRNFHRNWEITEHLTGAKIDVPTLFIAGEMDTVIGGASKEQLTASMSRTATDLRDVVLFPGIGHWVQQEAPEQTNAALLDFLKGL